MLQVKCDKCGATSDQRDYLAKISVTSKRPATPAEEKQFGKGVEVNVKEEYELCRNCVDATLAGVDRSKFGG